MCIRDSSYTVRIIIEGIIRIAIFVAYVGGISVMNDIKRLYRYHGAEHKCINCIEHGLSLTVENVRKSSKEHKRCGTSFMLFVMIVGIVLLFFVREMCIRDSTTSAEFTQINATVAGKKDMEEVVNKAKELKGMYQKRTILFIDEIHRFNKGQQDYLLPFVEDGTIILIGATTENPYFEVNGALLSRSSVFELRPLSQEEVERSVIHI